MAQWLSIFGSGHDPGVLGSRSASGSLQGTCFSLYLCVCLSVSHEQINKILKKKKTNPVNKCILNISCMSTSEQVRGIWWAEDVDTKGISNTVS